MFLDLFYGLRDEGVPVGDPGVADAHAGAREGPARLDRSTRFYHLARALPGEERDATSTPSTASSRASSRASRARSTLTDELLEWLQDPKNVPRAHRPRSARRSSSLSRDELMRRFLETLARADRAPRRRRPLDRHRRPLAVRPRRRAPDRHPRRRRSGSSRSAMKVAEERRFRDYRTDVDARRAPDRASRCERLRQLTRTGRPTELDLDETIDETCRNAGEIELVFRPPRAQRRAPAAADGRRRHRWIRTPSR